MVLATTIAIAGVVRGLSGFGTGMIVVPIAAALYDPVTAVVLVVIIDSLPTLPITLPVLKIARWREVLPVLAGLTLFLPVGVYILKNGDETALRWLICTAILFCAAGLWSGWRYHGPRSIPVSLGVGSLAGTLSGIASIPGPPLLIYWLASPMPARIVRANLLTLFLLGEALSIGNLWIAELFDMRRVLLALAMCPLYIVTLLIGQRLYGIASEVTYRRIAFVLIVLSALLALPILEPIYQTLRTA